jgi:hypothetical protein
MTFVAAAQFGLTFGQDIPQSVIDQANDYANSAGSGFPPTVPIRQSSNPASGAYATIGPDENGNLTVTIYSASFAFMNVPGHWELDFSHPFFLGLLINTLIHESLHSCGDDGGTWGGGDACGGGKEVFCCTHIMIANAELALSCQLVAALKAAYAGEGDEHEKCVLGEIIKGLCKAIKALESIYNTKKGADAAWDCKNNQPPCVPPLDCPDEVKVPPGVQGATTADQAYPPDPNNPDPDFRNVIGKCNECDCDVCQHPPGDCP